MGVWGEKREVIRRFVRHVCVAKTEFHQNIGFFWIFSTYPFDTRKHVSFLVSKSNKGRKLFKKIAA